MKPKMFNIAHLNQLRQSILKDQNQLRNFANQSYQEYQFYNSQHTHHNLIQNLIHVANKNAPETSLIDNLIQNHSKNFSCLLGYCKEMESVLGEASLFTFSHKSFASQSALLAFYLQRGVGEKVELAVSEENLSQMGHLIAGDGEEDKLSFTKAALRKEGVILHDLREWKKEGVIFSTASCVIVDLFGLSPMEYAPFLLRNFTALSTCKKAIIYHSHLQNEEVHSYFLKLQADPFPLQLWPSLPIEHIVQSQQKQLLNKLLEFLQEDLNHAQKQDIVIFYPIQMHPKKYTSKLTQLLAKAGLRDHVNFIVKPHQRQDKTKNAIFIVEGTRQLRQWNYDYSNLLFVIDYGTEILFTFNYRHNTYIRSARASSTLQKAKRMSIVGVNRIGKYSCMKSQLSSFYSHYDQAKQLSTYIVKMIDYGIFSHIDISNKRVHECLEILEETGIIWKNQQGYSIGNEQIVEAAKNSISPLQAKLLYGILEDPKIEQSQKNRYVNLMIMTLIVSHNENNLRQAKQQIQAAAHIKPNGIWRKSGYIDSCLEILTKCELIDHRKNNPNSKSETFRRKTSKVNEYEFEVFGSLFQIEEKKKKSFDQMEIPDLVRQYAVNDDLLNVIRDQIEDYRDFFEVQTSSIQFDKKDIVKIIQTYQSYFKKAIAIYSGSRRNGYYLQHHQINVFPDKTSLMSQLNERPQFITIFRLSQSKDRKQILMCNSMGAETYMEIYGALPSKKNNSISDTQIEIQFHGVSSSTFERLWKNNGAEIVKFEKQNDCFVEPNQQMALILIHCIKQKSDAIKEIFEAMLAKIRQKLSVSNKLVHYLGNTNLVLGAGGVIKQVIKSDYINKALLGNLHLNVTKQDLEELFEEFIETKDIVMNDPENGKFYKSAVIHFNSQRDYFKFQEIFNQCVFFERMMDIKPMKAQTANQVKTKQYIQLKWYVWKSHSKALLKFADLQGAKKALAGFEANPLLDEVKVKVTFNEQDNSLLIDDLKGNTDQIFIQEAMIHYGAIKQIQILKTPLKQISGEAAYLENLIRNTINNNQVVFKVDPIEKRKNGLRVCRVNIANLQVMNRIANEFNSKIGIMGQGRLYAQTWFEIPTLVPHNSMNIYHQILQQTLEEAKIPGVQHSIVQNQRKTYIVLKGKIKDAVDMIHQRFSLSLKGFDMNLTNTQRSIILTDIGIANILDIEQKYHCKLIANLQNKTLSILVRNDRLKQIKEEIRARVEDNFFYRISLNTKTFKYFKANQEKLDKIKADCALTLIELEIDSKALLLESSAYNVQKAFNYLMHFIESLTVPEEQMINADVCGICCEEPNRPYRLQNCSHKFCRDCMIQYVNSTLGDASLFPLRCPHCFKDIVIDDLELLLDQNHWNKVQTLAINQYTAQKADVMTFCFTAGCKQINLIKNDYIECDVCLATFCLQCKMRYHPGLTCEQAKFGGEELFKKFMKDNGIRECPNKSCKIPVERVDGCYRVTCSRCNTSMCFKCQPDKMTAYPDYNQCYQHLNEVHGGYW